MFQISLAPLHERCNGWILDRFQGLLIAHGMPIGKHMPVYVCSSHSWLYREVLMDSNCPHY